MSRLIQKRAIGGHLNHLVPAGKYKALCGFEPSAKRHGGRQMAFRHGWSGDASGFRPCRRCDEILRKQTESE